ncbi:MAG: DUF3016 domain-containing protein [Burkholderiaceae bacterium]
MRHRWRAVLLSCVMAVAGPASAAGTVTVSFSSLSKYADAGATRWEEDGNLKALAEHLQALGRRFLRDGEVLKIEVLDVDLAGTPRPSRRSGSQVRIVKGGADWPRVGLRYSLEVNGVAVRSADESVVDLNYTRGLSGSRGTEPLAYEKNMLEKWFKASFAEGKPQ